MPTRRIFISALLLIGFCHFVPLKSNAQFNDTITHYVYYGSSGTYNRTNDGNSFVLNNAAKFGINKKSYSFHSINSWIYGEQSGVRINNDFSAVADFDFLKKKKRVYYWALATFDKSFSLKINHRFQGGGGIGYNLIDKPEAIVIISDGLIYERADLTDSEVGRLNYHVWRNSFRIKYHWAISNLFILDGSGFLQPSLSSNHDNIIKSNTTMSFKIKKWLSLTAALNYNKITLTGRENLLITYGLFFEKYF